MDTNDLTEELRQIRAELGRLYTKVEDIRVNCAGRCGIVREAGRLVVAVLGAAVTAWAMLRGLKT